MLGEELVVVVDAGVVDDDAFDSEEREGGRGASLAGDLSCCCRGWYFSPFVVSSLILEDLMALPFL